MQGKTKLAGRRGGKGERQSACQLPHCAPVFALPGSGRRAGWDEGLWRGSIVALGRSKDCKKPLNCIWNNPCLLSDPVFIAWLVTTSLLLVVARRWGAVTPHLLPRTVFALRRWMGCCYLPSSILHSQKLSTGTASLLRPAAWRPSLLLLLLSTPIGTFFPPKSTIQNTLLLSFFIKHCLVLPKTSSV